MRGERFAFPEYGKALIRESEPTTARELLNLNSQEAERIFLSDAPLHIYGFEDVSCGEMEFIAIVNWPLEGDNFHQLLNSIAPVMDQNRQGLLADWQIIESPNQNKDLINRHAEYLGGRWDEFVNQLPSLLLAMRGIERLASVVEGRFSSYRYSDLMEALYEERKGRKDRLIGRWTRHDFDRLTQTTVDADFALGYMEIPGTVLPKLYLIDNDANDRRVQIRPSGEKKFEVRVLNLMAAEMALRQFDYGLRSFNLVRLVRNSIKSTLFLLPTLHWGRGNDGKRTLILDAGINTEPVRSIFQIFVQDHIDVPEGLAVDFKNFSAFVGLFSACDFLTDVRSRWMKERHLESGEPQIMRAAQVPILALESCRTVAQSQLLENFENHLDNTTA